jgi:hypothetical protein
MIAALRRQRSDRSPARAGANYRRNREVFPFTRGGTHKVLDSRLAEEEEKEKVYDQYVYGEASPRKSPRITAVANTGQLMVSYETTARKGYM